MSTSSTDPGVVEAIGAQRLASWADEHSGKVADAAAATCATIGAQMATQVATLVEWLTERGHAVTVDERARPRQRHDLRVDVASFDDAAAVADELSEIGFERWDRWSGAAARSFAQHATHITVARTRAHSEVLRITWTAVASGGRVRRLLRSLFRPTHGDWTMVSLPTGLWPLYSLVRPVRLVLERVGRRDPHAAGLGPFLSTPESIIEPMFDVVDLGPDDTLLDLGCGDGRLAIAAAGTRGCRAIGVEIEPELSDRARTAADAAGLGGLVTIVQGDARTVDVSTVTVAFMFLPMDVVAEILDDTLDRLPSGARLIVHEQTRLPGSIPRRPDSSTAILADDAVTVAHVWSV